jgi:hypothetical protein
MSIIFVTYRNFWTGIKEYLFVTVILILLLVPWTIRNYMAYKGFVFINTRTVDLREIGKRNVTMNARIKNMINLANINITKNQNYPSEKEREMIKKGLNPNKRSPDEIIAIKSNIYPASTFIKRKFYWFVELWRPARFHDGYFPFPDARFQRRWSLRHNTLGILCYGVLLPFMFLGFYILVKEKNKIWVFLTLPILLQTLLHVLQWGRNRYRIPIDCFVIIIAVFGFNYMFQKIRNRFI